MEFLMSTNSKEKTLHDIDLNITPQTDVNVLGSTNLTSTTSATYHTPSEGIQFPKAQTVRKIVFLSPISSTGQPAPGHLSTPTLVQSQCHSTPILPDVQTTLKQFPHSTVIGGVRPDIPCSASPVFSCSSSRVIEKEIVVEILKEDPRNHTETDSGFQESSILSDRHNSTIFINPTNLKVVSDSGLGWDGGNSNDSSVADVDKSLTNIRWLDELKFQKDKPILAKSQSTNSPRTEHYRKFYKQHEIDKISSDCGRTKRPPLSYVHLIQAALYSRTDRKMTLKEICSWIENKFLYYKYNAKPGWKNCIRHNLSLYNMFMRDPTQAKKHGCLWTIREGCSPRSKSTRDKSETTENTSVPSTAVIPIFHSHLLDAAQKGRSLPLPTTGVHTSLKNGSRKGPQPILPRLNTMQTFALVPIQQYQSLQGCGQSSIPANCNVQNSQSSINNGQSIPLTLSYHPPPPVAATETNISVDQKDCENRPPKYKVIAPKRCQTEVQPPVQNILQEAWLQAQNISDCEISENEYPPVIKNKKKKKPAKQSHRSRKNKSSSSLPKPKIYKKSSKEKIVKNTSIQSEKNLLEDSSDGEDFLTGLERDLPSPLQQLLKTPSSTFKSNAYMLSPLHHLLKTPSSTLKSNMTTSTPFKGINILSPTLPSPIKGPTPLRQHNLCDGSFLDVLKDIPETESICKNSATKLFPERTSIDDISPNLSWIKLNLNFSFSTPDKNDSQMPHNFSNILADFDQHFLEDGDVALDLSALNWNTSQSKSPGE